MSETQPFYVLPSERIAAQPPKLRGTTKLLVVDRASQTLSDKRYADVAEYIRPNDLVIINDTKVIKARLQATTPTGGKRELLLTEKHAGPALGNKARVIYRGSLKAGDTLRVGDEAIEVVEVYGGGQALIRATAPVLILAERYGSVPLPPYLHRDATPSDTERYQTVFARAQGSVAAPTASLNLTPSILATIEEAGATVAKLTLHVGRGTFLPIRTSKIEDHIMHQEYYSIPVPTVEKIRQAKAAGGRVIAIGTTVCRALEHAASDLLMANTPERIRSEADIFIHPGYDFQTVDVLLTNFHAPESTVLQLAAAFTGTELLKAAYDHALAHDYAFLSYGDSMLIL